VLVLKSKKSCTEQIYENIIYRYLSVAFLNKCLKLILFAFLFFNKLLEITGLNYGKFKIHKESSSL